MLMTLVLIGSDSKDNRRYVEGEPSVRSLNAPKIFSDTGLTCGLNIIHVKNVICFARRTHITYKKTNDHTIIEQSTTSDTSNWFWRHEESGLKRGSSTPVGMERSALEERACSGHRKYKIVNNVQRRAC